MNPGLLYYFVKKHNISKLVFIGYFTGLVVVFYFLFLTFFGEKGLVQFFFLKQQIKNKEAQKQELIAKMHAKKNMVEGMNTNSLDIDLLDEQARKTLGYTGKNEVVVVPNQSN